VAVALVSASPVAGARGREASAVKSALVTVYTVANPIDLLAPWQSVGTEKYVGSGVAIEGHRVLTNAHVVSDRVLVSVKREGMPTRHEARVAHIGHECDLALLEVEDEAFFEGVQSLTIGQLPGLRDAVDVYGFPIGGESVSVSSGIVSRIEVSEYAHSREGLLLAQIDAAINEGNSGGPVVADGKIVGIAVQMLDDAENVGYMVPAPVIRHFLEDVEDGRYDGFPSLGVEWQSVENRALRESLELRTDEGGALVTRVSYGSSAGDVLQPGDVVLAVDDVPIAQDVTISLPAVGQVAAEYAIQRKQVGDEIALQIARDGKRMTRSVRLRNEPKLVPGPQYDVRPSYLIFGGLVFQPLTVDFIELFEEFPSHMANYYQHQNIRTESRSQVIVLSQVLAAPVNRGYHDIEYVVVKTVNGKVPRDMRQLTEMIDDLDKGVLDLRTDSDRRLVIDVARAREAGPSLLKRYGIRRDRSPDLE
jgi:S1-C subfamily serine protease